MIWAKKGGFTYLLCTFLTRPHYQIICVLQVAEKAIVYFERAALMQPDEVKWQLMIGMHYNLSYKKHVLADFYSSFWRIFASQKWSNMKKWYYLTNLPFFSLPLRMMSLVYIYYILYYEWMHTRYSRKSNFIYQYIFRELA